jgi:hypothetical protein
MLLSTEKLQAFRAEVRSSGKRSSLLTTAANYGQRGYGTIGRGEKKLLFIAKNSQRPFKIVSLEEEKTFF